jgi:hypothetical protein
MRPGRVLLASLLLAAGGLSLHSQKSLAQAANSVAPAGDVIVEPSTLISAGFERHIDGDANRNATVAVMYRKKGDSGWRKGLPLLRIGGERTVFEGALDYTAPHMFEGSLFGLTENTDYRPGRAQQVDRLHRVSTGEGSGLSKPTQLYDPANVDLRLREGSAAIDAGIELPGITDGFQGRAPDLGAYELGAPPIHYGSRERPSP